MTLTLAVLTETLLDGLTDRHLVDFAASVPDADRSTYKARMPTREQLVDYVRGEQTDRNAVDVDGMLVDPHPKVSQPIRAFLAADEGVSYAMVLCRDRLDGSTTAHWVGRHDWQTKAAVVLVRDALVGRTMVVPAPSAKLAETLAVVEGVR